MTQEVQDRAVQLLKEGKLREAMQLASTQDLPSYEERVDLDVKQFNLRTGDLTGVDCELCRNKGQIAVKAVDASGNPSFAIKRCICMDARISAQRMEASGLGDLAEKCTFENFDTVDPWQRKLKQSAMDYLDIEAFKRGDWFFAGGQVGCGKTHLCTAICTHLIRDHRMSLRYMQWAVESVRLKSMVNDESFAEELNKLVQPNVLYIDDLFKTPRQMGGSWAAMPSDADIRLAFEIINARYIDRSKITIISSERHDPRDSGCR